jgi:lipid-A-disaccharide synthase
MPARCVERLGIVREKLGEGGGSENVARMALELMRYGELKE